MKNETRGRKKTYSVELLLEIIEKFKIESPNEPQTATALARFANSLGYTDIKYYHFTRNAEAIGQITNTTISNGREIKYTEQTLKTILEKCCGKIPSSTKINVSILVEYAKKLGYTDISAYHFTKYPHIKDMIDLLSEDTTLLLSDRQEADFYLQHHGILNAKELVNIYKNNPNQLIVILDGYSKRYEQLKVDYLNLNKQYEMLSNIVEELKQYKQEYTKLRDERNHYYSEYKRIAKYDKLNDTLYLLGKLKEYNVSVQLGEEYVQSLLQHLRQTKNDDDKIPTIEDTSTEIRTLIAPIPKGTDTATVIPFNNATSVGETTIQGVDDFLDSFDD